MISVRISVVFIETIVDRLYQYFQLRESSNISFSEFMAVISHPVERAIERFIPEADIAIYNHGSKTAYISSLRQFFRRQLG